MIKITPKDLLYMIPDLINLFLSGFIFMYTYNWINNKKNDISLMTLWSLFISFLLKSSYSALHTIILPNIKIHDSVKIIVFSLTGFLMAILFTYLNRTRFFTGLLYKINNKSINNDIFDDIIDYDKKTMMSIYLKSSDIYYIGRFSYREENGVNSWISLVDYYCVDKKTNNAIFNPEQGGLNSSVAINLSNVERIELIYEKDSKVWKKLKGKTNIIETEDGNIDDTE